MVYDRWDLHEGHDVSAFMERAVNDPQLSRVLVILNGRYAVRANARQGGVGAETMILAPEVYQDPWQTCYLPIVFGQHDGQACVPTFLRSRLYFDLSSVQRGFHRVRKRGATDPYLAPRDFTRVARHVRHASVDTTTRYVQVPDDDLDAALDDL